jgi:hypothetical protein
MVTKVVPIADFLIMAQEKSSGLIVHNWDEHCWSFYVMGCVFVWACLVSNLVVYVCHGEKEKISTYFYRFKFNSCLYTY